MPLRCLHKGPRRPMLGNARAVASALAAGCARIVGTEGHGYRMDKCREKAAEGTEMRARSPTEIMEN